jgi:predicted RNase H-like nuclease (RuvC/YqgF family)
VVLVVLVLLACPIFITQATVAPNWKQAYLQKDKEAKIFEATARTNNMAAQRAMLELDQLKTKFNDVKSSSGRDVDRLQTDLAGERLKVVDLQREIKNISTQLTELQESYKAYVSRYTVQTSQLDEARKNIDKLNEENRRLTELYKTAQSQAERLENAQRSLREQLADRDETIRQLQASGATAKKSGSEAPAAPTGDITGTVTAVKGDLASINVGSAQGVQKGMKLVIYRGNKWVAHLRVEEVDVSQAAGIVMDKQLDPAQGDKVASNLKP